MMASNFREWGFPTLPLKPFAQIVRGSFRPEMEAQIAGWSPADVPLCWQYALVVAMASHSIDSGQLLAELVLIERE